MFTDDCPEPPATSSDRRCQTGSSVRSTPALFEAWPSAVQPPLIVALADPGTASNRLATASHAASRRKVVPDMPGPSLSPDPPGARQARLGRRREPSAAET